MIIKKIVLGLFGIAFALAISSCNDQKKCEASAQKNLDKEQKIYSRKW